MKIDIEEILKKYLPTNYSYESELVEAMNYSVMVGGKRIRPTIMLETYKLFSGDSFCIEAIEPFMAAIEMIHSYSLVHDDLPAMDNDTIRRNAPTTWAKYGEAAGILTGDALLTYAFETAVKSSKYTDAERVLNAVAVLASKAGVYGMCGGQYVDVSLTGKNVSVNELDYIFENKTGALIEAAMIIGAIIGGATNEQIKNINCIASDIGRAFQIRDDILDIISNEQELGKPIGSDIRNDKTTYVSLYGMEKAVNDVSELSRRAIDNLNNLPGDKTFFEKFINELENRTK